MSYNPFQGEKWKAIPRSLRAELRAYVQRGRLPSNPLLTACVECDLVGVCHLDPVAKHAVAIRAVLTFLGERAPGECFGNQERVMLWRDKGGMFGIEGARMRLAVKLLKAPAEVTELQQDARVEAARVIVEEMHARRDEMLAHVAGFFQSLNEAEELLAQMMDEPHGPATVIQFPERGRRRKHLHFVPQKLLVQMATVLAITVIGCGCCLLPWDHAGELRGEQHQEQMMKAS
jgi:hypothetical protein